MAFALRPLDTARPAVLGALVLISLPVRTRVSISGRYMLIRSVCRREFLAPSPLLGLVINVIILPQSLEFFSSREPPMAADRREELTPLLNRVREGDAAARERVAETIYAPLHRIAVHLMEGERTDHTWTPTALLHEGLLRLFRGRAFAQAVNGNYLLAAAVQTMRRLLMEHERGRQAAKRGGGRRRRPLTPDLAEADLRTGLELGDAISALSK